MFGALGSFGFLLGPLFGGAIVQYGATHGDALTAFRGTFVAAVVFEISCAAGTIPLLLRLIGAGRRVEGIGFELLPCSNCLFSTGVAVVIRGSSVGWPIFTAGSLSL